jgi:hypothetical protein
MDPKIAADLNQLQTDLNAPVAPPAPAIPWFKDRSEPAPTTPITDLNDVAALKQAMAWGLRANLTRGVAESDWPKYLAYAEAVYLATLPQIASTLVHNAGNLDPDVAVYLILGGGTQGGVFAPLELFVSQSTVPDLPHAAAWLIGVPAPGGPGPSGQ